MKSMMINTKQQNEADMGLGGPKGILRWMRAEL